MQRKKFTTYKDDPGLIDQYTTAHVALLRARRKQRIWDALKLLWEVPVREGVFLLLIIEEYWPLLVAAAAIVVMWLMLAS